LVKKEMTEKVLLVKKEMTEEDHLVIEEAIADHHLDLKEMIEKAHSVKKVANLLISKRSLEVSKRNPLKNFLRNQNFNTNITSSSNLNQ